MLDPIFEGFSIWFRDPLHGSNVQSLMTQVLGDAWEARAFGDRSDDLSKSFDLTSSNRQVLVGEAWDLSYQLRELPEVLYAEPLFEAAISGRPDWNQDISFENLTPQQLESAILRGADICGSGPDFPHLKASDHPEWSLELMQVPSAWQRFFPEGGKQPGEGVVIGHPDTGFQPNPEILPNLLIDRGYDFLDCDRDATDPLGKKPPGVLISNPGHGTATSSVIISPRGDQTQENENEKFVSGVAPGAKLMPLRITNSVVLFGMMKLAQSIDYAVNNGAHVISISLGGVPSKRLWESINKAKEKGVIVTAAAGNCVRFVVWPAAYVAVIGAAACNAQRKIWIGSSRGEAVDVTAPGESVWHATAKRNEQTSEVECGVNRGNGTSFAVTAVAGVAALWLSYHGRDRLIQKYGPNKISEIFKQVLGSSCDPVSAPESEVGQFGAGIINAEKMLATPLPENVELSVTPFSEMSEQDFQGQGDIKTFNHLFEHHSHGGKEEGSENMIYTDLSLKKQLAQLLKVTEEQLPDTLREVGQELLFHLGTNPILYNDFLSMVSAQESDTSHTSFVDSDFTYRKRIEALQKELKKMDISQKIKSNLR